MSFFENALSSYVKDRVQRHYPDERSAAEKVEKEVIEFEDATTKLEEKVADLGKLIKEFKSSKNKQDWTGESMQVMGSKKADLEKRLRQRKKREKPGVKKTGAKKKVTPTLPVEQYILECR
jgi:predicted  nucleic acid-binding Zn-ribbon protein